jgi:hypothetical protein
MPITDLLIQRAAAADLDALCDLDARGLIPAPGEPPATYAARLEKLRTDLAEVEAELAGTGRFQIEEMAFPAADRIPAELFADAHAQTERLFAFRADWVPGFYVNPRFSWLFGGCAYSCHPDLFTVFIIRRSFASRARWFLYSRRELLAHELSHVARTSIDSTRFEERFAYMTGESGLRRHIGGAFHKPSDTFLMLGSLFLLLGAQTAQATFLERLPIWPFWCAALSVIAGLAVRHLQDGRRMARALDRLKSKFREHARAALFRCSDTEVADLAALPDDASLEPWLAARAGDLRWQIIGKRFTPIAETAPVPQ